MRPLRTCRTVGTKGKHRKSTSTLYILYNSDNHILRRPIPIENERWRETFLCNWHRIQTNYYGLYTITVDSGLNRPRSVFLFRNLPPSTFVYHIVILNTTQIIRHKALTIILLQINLDDVCSCSTAQNKWLYPLFLANNIFFCSPDSHSRMKWWVLSLS